MLVFLCAIALGDPQDIPEESEDSSSSENNGEEKDAETTTEQDAQDAINSPEETKPSERYPQALTEEDIALDFLMSDVNEEHLHNDDSDFSWFRGDLNYSLDFRFWESEGDTQTLFSGTFSGDPQYLWEINDDIGPTLGLRFKLSGTESQIMKVQDHLIGITTGFQLGPVRLNTAGSYMFNSLFYQEEISRDRTTKEISYRYQELLPLSGILWENTFTLTLDSDFVFQGYYSVPIGLGGKRDMGDLFIDSWQAGANIVYNTFIFGHQYNRYPQNQEHVLIFGSSLGR